MEKLIKNLNKEVANFGVLYTKLHNFHWFVEGFQFYPMHELFEKLYDEVTEHFDAVAERVLMLGHRPVATLKEFLQLASIQEAKGTEKLVDMLKSVVADFELIDRELQETLEIAQDLSDEVTADLLIGIKASLQKHLWMIKTTLR
jgi:starvation-inducible DNA-binding protein